MMLYYPHEPDEEKLEYVKRDLLKFGTPRIEVYPINGFYVAMNGVHRLRAAYEWGVAVKINIVAADDERYLRLPEIDKIKKEFGYYVLNPSGLLGFCMEAAY